MVPREDNKIELNPIEIPGWNYFTVNNLRYHDQDVSIVWDKDGSHYGGPAGYSLYVGGKLAFTSDKLAHLIYDPAAGTVEVKDDSSAQVTVGAEAVKNVKAANQVTFNADQRVTDLFAMPFNHHPVVESGLRAEEAQALLQAFFKDLRARLAAKPKWKPPVQPGQNMKKP